MTDDISLNKAAGNSDDIVRPRSDFVVPRLVTWQAKSLLEKLKQAHLCTDQASRPSLDFEKAEGLVHSLVTRQTYNPQTDQNPSFALCPKVRNLPFWLEGDSAFFDQVKQDLEQNYGQIRREYQSASEAGPLETLSNAYKGMRDKDDWMRYVLAPNMSFGQLNPDALKQFPETCHLLQQYGKRLASAAFYAMSPGVTLPPHTDSTNFFIVSHMGLQLDGGCGFQVENQINELHEKDVYFFDQSFVHSAWNKSEVTRVNLVLFFVHPDITDDELDLVIRYKDQLKKRIMFWSPVILLEMLAQKLLSVFKS